VGLFLVTWTLYTWMMLVAGLRTNVALVSVLVVTSIAFPVLAVSAFVGGHNRWTQAGGVLQIIDALLAWYTAATGLLTPTTAYFTLPNPKL
jgi:succinate-acetate transporter protein